MQSMECGMPIYFLLSPTGKSFARRYWEESYTIIQPVADEQSAQNFTISTHKPLRAIGNFLVLHPRTFGRLPMSGLVRS